MRLQAIEALSSEWKSAGLAEGDMVLLHSSLSRTLRRLVAMGAEASVATVLESVLLALGASGTLLVPLFNFDFTKGATFDIRTTPSQMGVFTEAARLWPGAVRTGHPIYSFAAIGAKAEMFRGVENVSGYGEDSPFGILHRSGGKIGVIDLPDQNSMTFYHYIEETLKVSYRYHKTFTGQYVDENGGETTRNFSLFVRDLAKGVVTHVDPMGERLWDRGGYTGFRPKEGCGLRVISTAVMFNEVTAVIVEGKAKGMLYVIER